MLDTDSEPEVICFGDKEYGTVSSIARYIERESKGASILAALGRRETPPFKVEISHVRKVGDYKYEHWLVSYGLTDWCVEASRRMTAEEIAQLP